MNKFAFGETADEEKYETADKTDVQTADHEYVESATFAKSFRCTLRKVIAIAEQRGIEDTRSLGCEACVDLALQRLWKA